MYAHVKRQLFTGICHTQSKHNAKKMLVCFRRFQHEWRVSALFPGPQSASPTPKQVKESTSDTESSTDIGSLSQKLMISKGLIQGAAPGTFHMLPFTTRAIEKLYRIIDREMHAIGAQKIAMPCLSAAKPWHQSGRWEVMGSELFTLEDRKRGSYCLSPTHEEAVTSIVAADGPKSYKRLPIMLYQIGRKFRDEMRPKSGLLRCREFEMKDLYTFDESQETARVSYDKVCSAYEKIFTRLGLKYVKVEADSGAMGGSISHEFQLIADVGEDTIYTCTGCGKSLNSELIDISAPKCNTHGCEGSFKEESGIEVAHAFVLGDRYSSKFKALYVDAAGVKRPLVMGCFGIGVTRLLAAALEVSSLPEQIRWPRLLSPHQIVLIPQKVGYKSEVSEALCKQLYSKLESIQHLEGEVVLDDRLNLSIGKRLQQAKQMGYPFVIIAGKRSLEETPLFEVNNIYDGSSEHLPMEDILSKAKVIETIKLW